jgi:hypothetical protein
MMALKTSKTENEYNEALARIDVLMEADPGTAQEEELELLTLLVEKYEEDASELPWTSNASKFMSIGRLAFKGWLDFKVTRRLPAVWVSDASGASEIAGEATEPTLSEVVVSSLLASWEG